MLTALSADRVRTLLSDGALALDLRPVDEHLASHPEGAVSLLFENGPGFGGRARDILPLNAKLVLLDDGSSDCDEAAAMLRGKGFYVAGSAIGAELPQVTTPIADVGSAGSLELIDVADPGTVKQERALVIPADRLWDEASALDTSWRIGVLAGWGVRAATAVGLLRTRGFADVTFVRTLPAGSTPASAGPESTIFRVRG